MILAGDIGGTKTHLALFDRDESEPRFLETYASADHAGLEELVTLFLAEHPVTVDGACFGIAGPVQDGRVEKINLAWGVGSREVARALGLDHVGLINDLEANAYGIASLGLGDLAVLHEGDPEAVGNAAVISPGTGLGEAGLYWDGHRHRVMASEGGHADFAPRTEIQVELWRFLAARHRHVSYERVCSGMGLVNIYTFLRETSPEPEPDWLRDELSSGDQAAVISGAALAARDARCEQALELMVAILGAEAGNLALKFMATGGIYVGGGIGPKVLTKLVEGPFVREFVGKGRFTNLLERVPVRVILNDRTALLGAARFAQAT